MYHEQKKSFCLSLSVRSLFLWFALSLSLTIVNDQTHSDYVRIYSSKQMWYHRWSKFSHSLSTLITFRSLFLLRKESTRSCPNLYGPQTIQTQFWKRSLNFIFFQSWTTRRSSLISCVNTWCSYEYCFFFWFFLAINLNIKFNIQNVWRELNL